MSFSDQGSLLVAQKLGCALYAGIAFVISTGFAISGAMGDCVEGDNCPSEFDRALMVFGVPFGFLLGGVLLTKFFMRDKDKSSPQT